MITSIKRFSLTFSFWVENRILASSRMISCWCWHVSLTGGQKMFPFTGIQSSLVEGFFQSAMVYHLWAERVLQASNDLPNIRINEENWYIEGIKMFCTAQRTLWNSHLAKVLYGMSSPGVEGTGQWYSETSASVDSPVIDWLIHLFIHTHSHELSSLLALLNGA